MKHKHLILTSTLAAILLLAACAQAVTPKVTLVPATAARGTKIPTETEVFIIPPTPSGPTVTAWNRYTPTAPEIQAVFTQTPVKTEAPKNTITRIPAGQTISVSALQMVSKTAGWALSRGNADAHDHLLRTQDGGVNWQDITPPEPIDLADPAGRKAVLFALDANTAWAVYRCSSSARMCAEPVVWLTGDGGKTWKASAALNLGTVDVFSPAQIIFINANIGWLFAHVGAGMSHDYVVILLTQDGGKTWKRIVDPKIENLAMSCVKNGMAFTDASQGWMAGDCQGVQAGLYFYKTSDGGSTWQLVKLPDPADAAGVFTSQKFACGAEKPVFPSAQVGVVKVNCNNMETQKKTSWLYYTADGGKTWTPRSSPALTGSFEFVNPTTGWFLGEKRLLQTKDGGKTWTPVVEVSWEGKPDFVDEQAGWVVAKLGDSLALVSTANGGKTWADLKPRISP